LEWLYGWHIEDRDEVVATTFVVMMHGHHPAERSFQHLVVGCREMTGEVGMENDVQQLYVRKVHMTYIPKVPYRIQRVGKQPKANGLAVAVAVAIA
jgi:hypothetical protein